MKSYKVIVDEVLLILDLDSLLRSIRSSLFTKLYINCALSTLQTYLLCCILWAWLWVFSQIKNMFLFCILNSVTVKHVFIGSNKHYVVIERGNCVNCRKSEYDVCGVLKIRSPDKCIHKKWNASNIIAEIEGYQKNTSTHKQKETIW
jgi:hypothetical protein